MDLSRLSSHKRPLLSPTVSPWMASRASLSPAAEKSSSVKPAFSSSPEAAELIAVPEAPQEHPQDGLGWSEAAEEDEVVAEGFVFPKEAERVNEVAEEVEEAGAVDEEYEEDENRFAEELEEEMGPEVESFAREGAEIIQEAQLYIEQYYNSLKEQALLNLQLVHDEIEGRIGGLHQVKKRNKTTRATLDRSIKKWRLN